ncbi:6-cysteine protein [Plasmodium sp. gorilla clade G2]|uniref:6-cysteine protein n=1 Tax=Plasmodium sp. gorilla clade G2 TaxID=880535 RepID=UPI000D21FD19|nr:6-cysteine protein [Plasmodium sp. gorilla clade G2]SOV18200.1 6-cysteine protein [Plasmodium sp. gorilla clade G2]
MGIMMSIINILLFYLFFCVKISISQLLSSTQYVCDFYFNPLTNVKPTVVESSEIYEEIGCTINNPTLGDHVVLICPKKNDGDFNNIEIVPTNCFESHLYSAYKNDSSAYHLKKLDIDKKYAISSTFSEFSLNILVIPNENKSRKTIYCRCDNSKTEKSIPGQDKILKGKLGLVKIILNNQYNNIKELEKTKHIIHNTKDAYKYDIKLKENDILMFYMKKETSAESGNCEDILNIKVNSLSNNKVALKMPSIFLNNINCMFSSQDENNEKYYINIKADKTENIDGCDFTKPKGEGIYKNGFIINDIPNEEERICTVYLWNKKNETIAGIKCPYKLTPPYCFKHILYQKEIDSKKTYKTFLLSDVLDIYNIEYYGNNKEGIYMLALTTKPEKSNTVRCICEQSGKKAVMDLHIASTSGKYFSMFLTVLLTVIFYMYFNI